MSCIVHLNGGVPAYSVMPKVVTVTFFVCVLPRIMCDTLRTSDIPQIYTVGKGVIYPILCSIHQIYVYQAYWYYWPVLTVRTMRLLYLSEILQYNKHIPRLWPVHFFFSCFNLLLFFTNNTFEFSEIYSLKKIHKLLLIFKF